MAIFDIIRFLKVWCDWWGHHYNIKNVPYLSYSSFSAKRLDLILKFKLLWRFHYVNAENCLARNRLSRSDIVKYMWPVTQKRALCGFKSNFIFVGNSLINFIYWWLQLTASKSVAALRRYNALKCHIWKWVVLWKTRLRFDLAVSVHVRLINALL